MKQLIKRIAPHVDLYRDNRTGIARVEDGTTGMAHSCHPNIDATGSVTGMRKGGYWRKGERSLKSGSFVYNIDSLVVTTEYDEIARKHCRCGGKH